MTRGTHDFGEDLEYWPWADNPTPGFDYSACCGKPAALCTCSREPEEDEEPDYDVGTVDSATGHPETCLRPSRRSTRVSRRRAQRKGA